MVLPENRTLNRVSVFPRRIRCPSTQNRNFSKLRAAGHGWIPRVSKRTTSSICASSRDFPLFGPRFPEEVFAWTGWRLISPRRNEFLRSPWRGESAAGGRTLVVQPPWSWVTRHIVEFTRRRRSSPPDPAGLSARHRPSFDSLCLDYYTIKMWRPVGTALNYEGVDRFNWSGPNVAILLLWVDAEEGILWKGDTLANIWLCARGGIFYEGFLDEMVDERVWERENCLRDVWTG